MSLPSLLILSHFFPQDLFNPELEDVVRVSLSSYLSEPQECQAVWIVQWAIELRWKYPEFMASPHFIGMSEVQQLNELEAVRRLF